MKEGPISKVEQNFVLEVIQHKKRIDGKRGPYDFRDVKIMFGRDRGCCHVLLGSTKVLAQCSRTIVPPKQTRSNEGSLFTNLELSPLANPAWEAGRSSTLSAQLNRQLEKAVKLSRCIDLEALCIIGAKQVWEIRVDVNVLSYDGNMIGASLLAVMAALSHYRIPDVSVDNGVITVHPEDEKAFLPLSVMSVPLAVSIAFFDEALEEKVMAGEMVVTMNKHREICALHTTGHVLLDREQVFRCIGIARKKVQWLSELLEEALNNDTEARKRNEPYGFAESLQENGHLTSAERVSKKVTREKSREQESMDLSAPVSPDPVTVIEDGVGVVGEGGASSWDVLSYAQDEVMSENRQTTHMEGGSDSEEECVVLSAKDV